MTSIKKLLLQNMLFITVISFVCLYFLWVLNEYAEFKKESALITENFAASEKERLKTQVQSILEYVHYMRGQTEKRVQSSIKERVNEAYAIAVNIYDENKDSKSSDEIKKMITDALRPIRFNRNRGYYFAFTMEGIETLFADRPEMEGKNMLLVQGARGEFVVRDMIQLIRTKGEGFYSYTWSKPGEKNPEHLKFAYVKFFEPYGWGIGTGEYVEDVKEEIQEEVLERISKIRFDNEGYFFGSIFGGQPLFTNGKITKGTENIWNLTDPKGVKIIQEQNRAARTPGGEFVSYSWQKMDSGKLSPKLSYVAGIPEWEWIIGAGVYLDTMDEIIRSKKKDLYHDFLRQAALYFAFMIFMSLLILLWINYQAHKIQSGIRLFSNFFETASSQAAAIDPTELQFEEFRRIAMAANQMINSRTEAIQTLRESEEKYRLMAENMSDVISLTDMDLGFTYVSPSITRLTGFSVEEALQHPIKDIIPPDSYKEILKIIGEEIHLEASGKNNPHRSRIIEYKQYTKDRSIIWVESNCRFLRDKDQKPGGFLIISRDITERKHAEVRLRESEARFKALHNASFGGIAVHDQGLILECNQGLSEMTGYEYTELIGMNGLLLIAKRSRKAVINNIRAGYEKPYEAFGLRKNGEEFPMQLEARNIPYKGKQVRTVEFRDITERKRAEEVLQKERWRLGLVIEGSGLGTWEWNVQTNETIFNETWTTMLGYAPEELTPTKIDTWSNLVHTGDLRKAEALHAACLAGECLDYTCELRMKHKDGHWVWILSRGRVMTHDEQGKPLLMFGTHTDITEIKQAEAEREKLQAQLNQAQKMESVGRLAGGVAHDFNNMLGVILGHTELALLRADENHDLYSDLKEIQTAAKRSADITKQLLAFARKQTISPRQLDLNDTVESMLNMIRRLIGEDIDLVWQPSAHLWSVKMDPSQIDQILANLCVNARDAIAGVGKLTIETGKKTFDEEYCNEHPGFIPGDFVLLAVSDNGCGMDKGTLDNLFEPFFTTKEVGKGTGLGLATIFGIVKQNNGFINVYSEPGRGSTFNIYLPRLVDDEDADTAVSEKKSAAGGTETILLAEDEPSILRMTRMMLERKGYSVLSAATPTEAMKKARNHSCAIDLLITDVVMPEMNGRDLSGQITDLYPDIRLLFMSGYTANVIAHQGVLDDGVAFIQKPFSMTDLAEKVREVLSGNN